MRGQRIGENLGLAYDLPRTPLLPQTPQRLREALAVFWGDLLFAWLFGSAREAAASTSRLMAGGWMPDGLIDSDYRERRSGLDRSNDRRRSSEPVEPRRKNKGLGQNRGTKLQLSTPRRGEDYTNLQICHVLQTP